MITKPCCKCSFWCFALYGLLCSFRPMLQLLRRVVKKESSSLMTVRKRRIFGMKKKLTMQHKSNPDRGTAHGWYAWGNRFGCFVHWIHILCLFFSGLGCLFLQIIHPRVPWGMGVEAAGRPLRKRMLRKRPVLSSLQQLRLRVSAITSPTTLNFSAEFLRWTFFVFVLCTDPGWAASFSETEVSSSGAWGGSPQQGGNERSQDTGWATFTEFQPFSR